MYFESSSEHVNVITERPVEELLIESLPVLDYTIDSNRNNKSGENDMNFNKDYSTYHSENNCRDWMLTD